MKVGIDFGSTYSTAAVYNRAEDRVEALSMVEGESASVPSVVSISKKGKVTCGKAAKEQVGKKTVRTFEAFKMLLTEQDGEMLRRRGYDAECTPRYMTKLFLDSLLKGALTRYPDEEIEDVIVCVPEIWGKNMRTLDGRSILRNVIKDELEMPVGHVRVVTEPEAASAFFAYNYEKETGNSFNGYLLLIDYGGGTLDITLTQVRSDGSGKMEISYREGGGAGENHPGEGGAGTIGSAGVAYMQGVIVRALLEQGLCASEDDVDYASPAFLAAVRELESQMKNADRMAEIEDFFGSFGSGYRELEDVLEEPPTEFIAVEYEEEELQITFQQLYSTYTEIIEHVLQAQVDEINARVRDWIGADPCEPAAGERDDFKIAVVGGFGAFYLVKRQLSEIYRLDVNEKIDRRTKNLSAGKREQAIALGAALLACGKVILKKTSRYSIGLYTAGPDRCYRLHYGIRYHQIVEPGRAYYLRRDETLDDTPDNRVLFGALHGNLTQFAIEFTERAQRGGLMALNPDMLRQLEEKIPADGFWNCGFSLDESDIVSLHLVSRSLFGNDVPGKEIVIPLDSYRGMFNQTANEEVTVEDEV